LLLVVSQILPRSFAQEEMPLHTNFKPVWDYFGIYDFAASWAYHTIYDQSRINLWKRASDWLLGALELSGAVEVLGTGKLLLGAAKC
jgi:hypothetical protein